MTKILVAGDWHGATNWVKFPIRKAVAESCPIIMQVGDFGYWEHTISGIQYLDRLNLALEVNDLELYWIDGNHENHTMLRANYGPDQEGGFWDIRSRIHYVPRGTRWTWDGITCLGLGGAYSIDKAQRVEGVSWWPEELITTAEVYKAVEGGKVDVMFTHDCPVGVNPLGPDSMSAISGYKDWIAESYHNRQMLSAVVDEVKPQRLYHGHYHHRYSGILEGPGYTCIIEGLDRDSSFEKNWIVLDTNDLTHVE